MNEELETLRRLVYAMIRLASVVEVDASEAWVKVQFMDTTTSWVPWITARAGGVRSWSAPSIGEQVLVLCPNGATEQAIILPALYQEQYPPPATDPDEHLSCFADGAVLAYNDKLHRLQARLPDGATTDLVSNGGVSIVGNVQVTGNLQASGDIHADGQVSDGTRSMAADRGIYNGHIHGSSPTPSQTQ